MGELITERVGRGGGREVTVHLPADPPEAVLFAGDGQVLAPWGATLAGRDLPSTMVVGVHRRDDETERLHEYSPGFAPEVFAAHERLLVEVVRPWVAQRFGVELPRERTAAFGASASGELALALGLRHPEVFGAVLCASPGAGFRPPDLLPEAVPRTYLVAGTEEPFFHDNAVRWATALADAGVEVVMATREGGHGDPFWRDELPAMVGWAFGETDRAGAR